MDVKNAESVDDDNEAERLHRLQVAYALRDAVSEFIAGSQEEAPEVMREVLHFASQRIALKEYQNSLAPSSSGNSGAVADCEQTFCRHECAHHGAVMNPALWGNLPSEILHLIFARLPLPDVLNVVPELSKKWKRKMEDKSPEFRRMLADASPKMFGLITQNMRVPGKFWLRLYDLGSTTWHVLEIVVNADWEPFDTMRAADGGLVCFVSSSRQKTRDMPIVVANPLTGDIRELPVHSLDMLPRMVQIVLDRNTKFYQVIIVGDDGSGNTAAKVFHSGTGVWTSTKFSSVPMFFGYSHIFYGSEDVVLPMRFCAYDCAEETLVHLDRPSDLESKGTALVQDRVFVLSERPSRDETTRWVTEFQVRKSSRSTVFRKVREFHCEGLRRCPQSSRDYETAFYACKDFVLVVAETNDGFRYRHSRQYLFDLATSEWQDLPQLPQADTIIDSNFMCELRWDIVP